MSKKDRDFFGSTSEHAAELRRPSMPRNTEPLLDAASEAALDRIMAARPAAARMGRVALVRHLIALLDHRVAQNGLLHGVNGGAAAAAPQLEGVEHV